MRCWHNTNNIVNVVHITKNLAANGITSVVLNYTKNISKEKFNITIVSGPPIHQDFKSDCEKSGISVIEVPSKGESPFGYYIALWRIISNGKFDVVHIHGNSATISVELLMAFLCGVKVRIAHCHNSSCEHPKAHRLLLPLFKLLYTKGYACSDLAGQWLFQSNQKYEVIRNGFDINKYQYNEAKRNVIRSELGLGDKFVIGNVAGFNDQKNHIFLLEIFEKIADVNSNAILFLVGEGHLLKQIQALIKSHKYGDRIYYFGITNHIEDLYNVMDVFLLPSKYEGLGLVFLEAQINGLKCFASDCVPREVNLNDQTTFISLDEMPERWADFILESDCGDRSELSDKACRAAETYDIRQCVSHLEKEYLSMVKEKL